MSSANAFKLGKPKLLSSGKVLITPNLSSAKALTLDQAKILSFGKEINDKPEVQQNHMSKKVSGKESQMFFALIK